MIEATTRNQKRMRRRKGPLNKEKVGSVVVEGCGFAASNHAIATLQSFAKALGIVA